MHDNVIEKAAQVLRNAELSGLPCEPIRSLFDEKDMAAAYAVKQCNHDIWHQQQRQKIGCKIGITSLAVQSFFGMTEPDYGFLYSDMQADSGGTISRGSLFKPKLEVEIGLVLGKDINLSKPTKANMIEATAYFCPVFEVVDSRIENWDVQAVDTIADNGSSGRFVIGNSKALPGSVDINTCSMTLFSNTEVIASACALDSLGDPIEHAVWLATKLAAIGAPLKAGDILLTGALAPMIDVKAGGDYKAVFEGLGSVAISFGA